MLQQHCCLSSSVSEEAKERETIIQEEGCNMLLGKFILLSPLHIKFPSSQDQMMMGFLWFTEVGLNKLRMSTRLSNPAI